MNYKQCHMVKQLENGTKHITSYIPEKYAVLNKIVKLRDDDGEWEDGWRVISAGEAINEKLLPDWHKDIRLHRTNTGDSLKKEAK